MAYVLIIVVVLLIVGVVGRTVLAAQRGTPKEQNEPDGSDVTSRDTPLPTHPDRPIPGSDTARE